MRGMTVTDKELERREINTAPGMAFWAGTGPAGATCGKCEHYGYHYDDDKGLPRRKTKSCAQFFRMTGRHGGSLTTSQSACKYFKPD